MRDKQTEEDIFYKRIRDLREKLANIPLDHFTVADLPALMRLTTLPKLPSEKDLAQLEKIAEDINNGNQ